MNLILRTCVAFAALGAGLIHIAISAAEPLSFLGLFALIGAAEVAWAILALARPRLAVPRIALVGALVPIVLAAIGLTASPTVGDRTIAEALPFLAVLSATVLDLFVAVVLAIRLRQGKIESVTASSMPNHRETFTYLGALLASAAVMTVLTVPAIAATPVGLLGNNSSGGHAGHGATDVSELESDHDH